MPRVGLVLLLVAAAGLHSVDGVGADIKAYERATPQMLSSSFRKASDKYPEKVQVSVPHGDVEHVVDLTVNTDLFHPDWSLAEYGNDGALLRRLTDPATFMCHYKGTVRGENDSYATMSLCDDLGLRGHIHTPAVDIEVQHHVPLSEARRVRSVQDEHIVFRLRDLNLDGFVFGEPIRTANRTAPSYRPTPPRYASGAATGSVYTNSVATASDSYRMGAFSSSNAEALNTQSVMNHANSPYSSTNWGNGNTLRHIIRTQVQNAQWTHSDDPGTKLGNLATFRENYQPQADNVQGLTHYDYRASNGRMVGLGYLNTMCRPNSCAWNSLGFTSSDTTRGILVAHEMGHNYAFSHDSDSQGGPGYVMWPSISGDYRQFSSYSISQWNSHRESFTCLSPVPQTPQPVPQTPAPSSAACAAHAGCSALGLTGDCCPAAGGVMLGCCSAPPPPSNTGAACSAHAACAAAGLAGDCCPTTDGVTLGCC